MAYIIAYGDPVTSTGTIALTIFEVGDTVIPVGKPLRVVQSTKELTGKQVEKYLTTATINAWRDENGKYIQVERT